MEGFITPSPCQKGRVSRVTGASTVEALVGAVWVDSQRDLAQVHRVIHNLNIGDKLLEDSNHHY